MLIITHQCDKKRSIYFLMSLPRSRYMLTAQSAVSRTGLSTACRCRKTLSSTRLSAECLSAQLFNVNTADLNTLPSLITFTFEIVEMRPAAILACQLLRWCLWFPEVWFVVVWALPSRIEPTHFTFQLVIRGTCAFTITNPATHSSEKSGELWRLKEHYH